MQVICLETELLEKMKSQTYSSFSINRGFAMQMVKVRHSSQLGSAMCNIKDTDGPFKIVCVCVCMCVCVLREGGMGVRGHTICKNNATHSDLSCLSQRSVTVPVEH